MKEYLGYFKLLWLNINFFLEISLLLSADEEKKKTTLETTRLGLSGAF